MLLHFSTSNHPPHPLYRHSRYNLSYTMLKVPRWLEDVLSLDGTLDKKEQQKRVLFFAFNVLALFFISSFVASLSTTLQDRPIDVIGTALFTIPCCTSILAVLCKARLSTSLVVTISYLYVGAIVSFDFSLRTLGTTVWPTLVLVVDLLLVMQTPACYTFAIVCFTIAWLLLMGIEERVRFGLLDMPGLAPQGGPDGRRSYFDSFVGCTDLPCPRDTTQIIFSSLSVFVIDFVVTRQFGYEILKEQASMERTINAVQEIASLLAGYDVEKVAQLLEAHEHELPEGMTTALRCLEENLRVYKAYLPQTCLPFERLATDAFSSVEVSCESVSLPSSVSSERGKTVFQQTLDLSFTKATLLTLNIKDTLHLLEEDSASFSDLFTTLLQKTLQATETRRGMVDVFVGDRIHCSFNTSKQCASHATSALHAVTLLLRGGDAIAPHVNMGVATGKVLRGDMGCAVMRRFSMVGALVRDVNVLERAGRVLGCSVLCNRLCFSDAECEHHLRLIPCKVEVGESREEVVAELVVPKKAAAHRQEAEWMYMLEGNKQWYEYNTAVLGYLQGDVSASAVAAAAACSKVGGDNADNIAQDVWGVSVDIAQFSEVCEVLQLPVQTRRIASMTTNTS